MKLKPTVTINEILGLPQRLCKFLNNRASTRSKSALRLHAAIAIAGRAPSAKELFLKSISEELLKAARAAQEKEAEEALDAGLPPPTVLAVRNRLGAEAWEDLHPHEREVFEGMAKVEKDGRLLVKQGQQVETK